MGSDSLFWRLPVTIIVQCVRLSNTQKHRISIENLIIDGPVQTMFSKNKTLSEVKDLLSSIMKLKKSFACKLNCLKQKKIF